MLGYGSLPWLAEIQTKIAQYNQEVRALIGPLSTILTEQLQEVKKADSFFVFNEKKLKLGTAISLANEKTETSKAEKAANRGIILSLVSLGFSAGALLYPSLIAGSVIGLACFTIPRYQIVYQELFKERRVTVNLLDVITLTGFYTLGFYFVGSLSALFASISQRLLAKTQDDSQKRLINIFGEQPRTVWRFVDGVEIETPLDKLQKDDLVVVCAGQTIPVDGTIAFGMASIDQHRLTGEAQPAEKEVGDTVFAATVILSGEIHVSVEKTGTETQIAQIGNILSETANFKMAIQSRGETFADKSVLPTIAAGSLGALLLGTGSALAIVYCPIGWFIRVTAPISLLNFLRILSQNEVFVKDARSLELLTKIDTVVFDKTGTLTTEQPHVNRIYTCSDYSENILLQYAATAEWKQTHPIAKAILTEAEARQLNLYPVEDMHYEVGYGIKVQVQEQMIRVGSSRFMAMEGIEIPSAIQDAHVDCSQQGHSLVMVAIDNKLAGAIELQATIRPEVKAVIKALNQRKKTVYIISGDHEQPTQKLAHELGIDHYFANTLPSQKADMIDQLQTQGKSVCFIGDGINDSIALRKATVSISLAGATTVATDIAQVVFMDGSLARLPMLFDIAHEMEANMNNNFVLSVAPGAICIAGAFLLHFGMTAAMFTFFSGLFLGIGNSMMPLLRHSRLITVKENTKD